MKKVFILFFACCMINSVVAQNDMSYFIQGAHQRAMKDQLLFKAESLRDLNPGYPSSWLNESDYVSTTIKLTQDEESVSAIGDNEQLTSKQKDVLGQATIGSEVMIEVKYTKANAATGNVSLRTISASYTVIPSNEASFSGGQEAMNRYMDEQVMKHEGLESVRFEMATVGFTINKNGEVENVKTVKHSSKINIDVLLIDAIKNMPNWVPAKNSKGENVAQRFDLMIGSLLGC